LDVLEDGPGWLRAGYPALYLLLVRYASALWGAGYALLDHPLAFRMYQPLRRAWNMLVSRRFTAMLRERSPDVVVVTHFMPADIVVAAQERGWFRGALVVVVTDLHPHRFWLSNRAQTVVVATTAGADRAKDRGIAPDRLRVLGIPISGTQAIQDLQAVQRSFGLTVGRCTVLVTSGGTTVGPFEPMVKRLLALEQEAPGCLQLIVVCGHNEAARERLARAAATSAMPVTVLGFTDRMAEAMAASDLIVAKAGGLTVAEALGQGRPMVLYHAIPGQEQSNAELVCQHGAGVMAHGPRRVAQVVRELAQAPEVLRKMAEVARELGRPDAAHRIATEVVKPLLERTHGQRSGQTRGSSAP
jgi:processive 1,2-diacylglycerol beta-glucosyltransferase